MKQVFFRSVPFDKTHVTLALESGVDGIIVEAERVDDVAALGRVDVLTPEDFETICLTEKADEATAVSCLRAGGRALLSIGWEIIPVENILAQAEGLGVEVTSASQAELAAGILERGVDFVVVTPEGVEDLKKTVALLKLAQGSVDLVPATITEIRPVGLGHRVCVDTINKLSRGEGMLVGNSSAFTFLVHAETESNPYVAARPFRINAGAVHAYCQMPGDTTRYLEELAAGDDVLIVAADGSTHLGTVGRVKVEIRPMLLIRARVGNADDDGPEGAVFLQNAETIRVVDGGGNPVSVVTLAEGDTVMVRTDAAGRHFGMRIDEEITEG